MSEKVAYWASLVLGGAALVLLVLNMFGINGNRQMQEEINQRQANINGGATLGQIDNSIVQALAEISIKNSDVDARGLLAAQGITITPNAPNEESKSAK